MSATATATKPVEKAAGPAVKAVADALGMDTLPLADLRKLVDDDLAIARAWAAGDIEFGHRTYCVTGAEGKDNSALVVEDGWEWTGPKTRVHKNFRDLLADKPPAVKRYKKYELSKPTQYGEEPVLRPVEIAPDVALAAIALHVRLTDKGLGQE